MIPEIPVSSHSEISDLSDTDCPWTSAESELMSCSVRLRLSMGSTRSSCLSSSSARGSLLHLGSWAFMGSLGLFEGACTGAGLALRFGSRLAAWTGKAVISIHAEWKKVHVPDVRVVVSFN